MKAKKKTARIAKPTKEPRLLDKIASWIDHVRAHGVTDEQVQAALEMDVPSFLKCLERDIDFLVNLSRLRPGAMPSWVLHEVEELATGHWQKLSPGRLRAVSA